MTFTAPNFTPAIPEMFLLAMTCLTLLVNLYVSDKHRKVAYYLAQLALLGTAVLSINQYSLASEITFNGSFIHDRLSDVMKLFIYLTGFGAFFYSQHYVKQRDIPQGEYYVLGLFSILGMMVLVSAYSFLTIYLGLELVSLPLYALVGLQRNRYSGTEAALKYFVMGAIASGMLLYGLSLLYGATGQLEIAAISKMAISAENQWLFSFGLVFVIMGIAFKLAAAPFHMWAPDVYQGAPTSVTLFLSSVPKIAALGMAMRLLVDALPSLHGQWQQILMIVAVLSFAIGNLTAIMQENIKRMFAYSAIAHMGYMLLGLVSGTDAGYSASLFYVIIYSIMSMGAFAMLIVLSKVGFEAEHINDFRGLNARNPWLAFMMLILLFSMAGVPPTVGFFAKFGVLKALVDAQYTGLAITALIFAVIGAFYYLRVITVMYFKEAEVETPVHYPVGIQVAVSINALALLALGLFPSALMTLCQAVFN